MTQNVPGGIQSLRNLASALREQQGQLDGAPKLPTATDQDILRAMLGKRWGSRTVEATPVRKAG